MFSRYINLQVVITTLFSCYVTFVFSLYQFRFLHFFSFFNFIISLQQLCFLVISNLFFFCFLVISTLFSCYISFVFFHFFSNFLNFVFSLHRTSFSRYINFVFSLYQLHALVISTSCSFHVNFVPLVHLLIRFGYSAHRSFYSTSVQLPVCFNNYVSKTQKLFVLYFVGSTFEVALLCNSHVARPSRLGNGPFGLMLIQMKTT